MAAVSRSVLPDVEANLDVLRRICVRGRNYFFDKKDSSGIDLFDHMETEVNLLASALGLVHPPHSSFKENP